VSILFIKSKGSHYSEKIWAYSRADSDGRFPRQLRYEETNPKNTGRKTGEGGSRHVIFILVPGVKSPNSCLHLQLKPFVVAASLVIPHAPVTSALCRHALLGSSRLLSGHGQSLPSPAGFWPLRRTAGNPLSPEVSQVTNPQISSRSRWISRQEGLSFSSTWVLRLSKIPMAIENITRDDPP